MINKDFLQNKIYLSAAEKKYDAASVVLFGVPLDSNSSFRPGARFAPEEIRKVFESLEDFSPALEKDLNEVSFCDAGDMKVMPGTPLKTLQQLKVLTKEIIKDNKKTLVIGGDHSVTPPIVEAYTESGYSNLAVIQFDAHLDLRPDYLGEENSHACAIYRILEAGVKNVYQMGIRSGTKAEFKRARKKTIVYQGSILAPLEEALQQLGNNPVYITMDIDVVDPAFAPGTGTPEPGGISSSTLLKAFSLLKEFNIVGFDLVEVNPPYDRADITALLGAKLIREALLIL